MTVFMVTHDIAEAFKLGSRLIVFDKVRYDPDDSSAAGATITYDLPLRHPSAATDDLAITSAVSAATTLDRSVSILSNEMSTGPGGEQ
jgi:NitT/TauT family transport system ATP-binding protein